MTTAATPSINNPARNSFPRWPSPSWQGSWIFSLLFLTALPGFSQGPRVDSLLKIEIVRENIPGLAACTVEKGRVVWTGYYGFQDIEKNIPVSSSTQFMIASVSKTITAAALMQLHAAGKFKLDEDINRFLDFTITHPMFPETPITFRQLLQHRSSIADNSEYLGQFWNVNRGDPTIPLGEFLKNYLSPKGKQFNREKNFYGYPPGSYQVYSNIGFALIGYLVERISGQPFDAYCRQQLFEPLDMNRSAWFLRDLDPNTVAMPYRYSDTVQRFIPFGHGGYPDYPAGQLRTSVEELSHFLVAWTQGGRWKNKQVFDSATIQLMTPDFTDLGYHTWMLHGLENGKVIYGHPGGDNGVSSFMLFDPATKKGVIIIANGRVRGAEMRKIINLLFSRTP